MKKRHFLVTRTVCIMGFLLINGSLDLYAQENEIDRDKINKAIVGEWEFDSSQGELMMTFTVEKGKLMAAAAQFEVEFTPEKEKELEYSAEDPSTGLIYIAKFERDAKGKIEKCTITNDAMGVEFIGVKIK